MIITLYALDLQGCQVAVGYRRFETDKISVPFLRVKQFKNNSRMSSEWIYPRLTWYAVKFFIAEQQD